MGENSKIEWTDHTFNPWIGCTKVSPGCTNCYAEAMMDHRMGRVRWGGSRQRTSRSYWRQPVRWNADAAAAGVRRRVFCASLADVFDIHPSITSGWIGDLWHLISITPNLDWLLLTKRPANIRQMLPEEYGMPIWGKGWSNVWLGTTIEDQQRADERIDELLSVHARVRFLSCEPLLGPVNLDLEKPDNGAPIGIHWIICGGESGPKARPMHPDWARSLRDQAQAAGAPFFFKQWGEWAPWHNPAHYTHGGAERHIHAWISKSGETSGDCWIYDEDGSWSNWTGCPPAGMCVLGRHGKAAAGRLLDNRTWDEVPR